MSSGLVLLIEDDDDLREIASGVLRRAGFRVVTACEGTEALRLVQVEMPGVIFLDWKMPGMDGPTFARTFRELHPTSRVPLIVFSASREARAATAQARVGLSSLPAGASPDGLRFDGALCKPCEAADLIAMATQHLASAV